MDFRTLVLAWLDRRGWYRAQLADAAGVSQSLVSKWLSDEEPRATPAPKNLAKLAPVLGMTYEDLMRVCGYLPGVAELPSESNKLEGDIRAHVAELLAATREAPECVRDSLVGAALTRAISEVRETSRLLRDHSAQPPAVPAVEPLPHVRKSRRRRARAVA